ncbi:MAG TPA: methionyl-tRNA formyltransferase [Anaeromyxobacteraceae bacterium]
MRIAFLGTPPFAVASLEALAAAGHDLACVVAQPDRPAGRGRALRPPATKTWARARGLPVLQPEKVRDGRLAAELRALRPDLLAVVAYGRILGRDLLELAPHGAVNLHASLLPRWRGAAPVQWAVAEGDAWTGVTVMRMDEGLDTGPILLQRAAPIGPEETAEELSARLAALGAAALAEALPLLAGGALTPVRQDPARVTLAPVVSKEHGRLDFRLPAARLAARVRGFVPWPGAFTALGGRILKVHGARALAGDAAAPAGGPPGSARAAPAGILVACGEGSALLLTEVQLEGKRRMDAAEFARGAAIAPGSVLGP